MTLLPQLRIFDRYMAMRFIKPFAFGLGMFAILIFLGDLFDKLPRLVKSPASMLVILEYLWLEVPYWCIRIIPMATLLATLFAIAGFIQSGEWIAVQASGFETKRFFRPIFYMGAFVTLLSFAAQETILPACYHRAQVLWREQIHPEWEWDKYFGVMLIGRPNQFVTVKQFVVKEGWMERPVMDYYTGDGITRQIDAKESRWDPAQSRWVFFGGVDRHFSTDGKVEEFFFDKLVSDLQASPKVLVPRTKKPDEMSIREMRRYLLDIRRLGSSAREAWAAFHAKIAYPFANMVVCALGIPIALRLGRASKALSFGVALFLSFFYLFVLEMGQALGSAGALHPALAAWAPHLIFGTLAWRLGIDKTVPGGRASSSS